MKTQRKNKDFSAIDIRITVDAVNLNERILKLKALIYLLDELVNESIHTYTEYMR